MGGNSSFIFEACSGEDFLADSGDFMQFEDGAHCINVRLEEFEVNVLVSTQWIHFFEFVVEFESNFIVV